MENPEFEFFADAYMGVNEPEPLEITLASLPAGSNFSSITVTFQIGWLENYHSQPGPIGLSLKNMYDQIGDEAVFYDSSGFTQYMCFMDGSQGYHVSIDIPFDNNSPFYDSTATKILYLDAELVVFLPYTNGNYITVTYN